MRYNLEKFFAITRPMTPEESADLDYLRENNDWLCISATIALKIRQILRFKGISQADLANLLSVPLAQVSKLLSGKVNFELKTIAKLQSVLGEPIIEVDLSRKTDEIPEKKGQHLSREGQSYVKNDNDVPNK